MHYRLKRNEWHKGWDSAKKDLLDVLRKKVLQYGAHMYFLISVNDELIMTLDDLLLKYTSLRSLEPTPERNHRSVYNWIWGEKPLDEGEYDFIYHQEDFVSVVDDRHHKDCITGFLESCLNRWPSSRLSVTNSTRTFLEAILMLGNSVYSDAMIK